MDIVKFEPEIVVSTGIYGAGDSLGGKIEIADRFVPSVSGSGVLETITLVSAAAVHPNLTLIFFDSDPDATTFTDNGLLDLADADLDRIMGIVDVPSASWVDFNDNTVITLNNIGFHFKMAIDNPRAYMAIMINTGVTYAAVDDFKIKLLVRRD